MSTDFSHDTDPTVIDPGVQLALAKTHLRGNLLKAADLLSHVRSLVTPGGPRPSDGQPRGSSSSEAALPLRTDPLEDSDRVYAHLLNWVRYWADELQIGPPVAAVYAWATDGGPQGFRSTVTPLGAWGLTQTLTTWLLLHDDRIWNHPDMADYVVPVDQMLYRLSRRYPIEGPTPKATLPRPCPVCGQNTMMIERRSEAVTDLSVVCSFCRFEGDALALMRDRDIRSLLTDIRFEEAPPAAEWWTKRQAVEALSITARTLDRYIRDDNLPTKTSDGAVWVNADELCDLWRRKHASVLATRMLRLVGAEPAPRAS